MAQIDPQTVSFLITAVVVGVVLLLRMRRMRRARPLRLETLWVVPAVLGLAVAVATWEYPPLTAAGWLALIAAVVIGGAIGWVRGMAMRIGVDPATHALNQQSSPAAFLFVVLLIVARQGLRYEAAALGIDVLMVTGLLLAFAFGLVSATRAEMHLRARRLLADARAGHTPSGISTGPTSSR
jgi:membrane protein CcdC involved in cytochrome C biogenesis